MSSLELELESSESSESSGVTLGSSIHARSIRGKTWSQQVNFPALLSAFEAVSTSIGRGAARPSSISTYMRTGTRQLTFVVCKKVGFTGTLFLLQRWFGVFHFYGQRIWSRCPSSVSTCMCTEHRQRAFVIGNRLGFASGVFLLQRWQEIFSFMAHIIRVCSLFAFPGAVL